jgi:hypothetical protein
MAALALRDEKLAQQIDASDRRGAMEREKIRNDLPAGMVTHTVTPSGASAKPATTESLFNTLQLNMTPVTSASSHKKPTNKKWKDLKFEFSWSVLQKELEDKLVDEQNEIEQKGEGGEDGDQCGDLDEAAYMSRKDPLEVMSYEKVKAFISSVGEVAKVIGNGQQLTNGLLFDQSIWTLRPKDPRIRGQRVNLRHIVRGRSDVAVLSEDPGEGKILPWMVKFLIEVKTAKGLSSNGSKAEAMVQLIGLNAASERRSPPVVLTNLVQTHSVFYLKLVADVPSPVKYKIYEQKCSSFASAVHYALSICDTSESEDFCRPPTPELED